MSITAMALEGPEVEAYLARHARKDMLRFITCGSVDDGKSTLIGRLLFEAQVLLDDQMAALEADSARHGTTGVGNVDFALLVDGLQAEREQGITIDVAYRFFTTDRRKFIVADTPGHEQYTRNMVTGASTADAAILLVDARKGVVTQTRRHAFIAALMGIREVVLAVNKMDLVGYRQAEFAAISADFAEFAAKVDLARITCIPVSATAGDNVTQRSDKMAWYKGEPLLRVLEDIKLPAGGQAAPFRFPVQWVNRPNQDFRGYAGTITSGSIRPGDPVVVLPSARMSSVRRIVTMDGDLPVAVAGQAVTLALDDDIDISRGDMIAAAQERPELADQLAAHLVWMDAQPLLPGRSYVLRTTTGSVNAQITRIKHKVNVNTLEHAAATHLDLNEVASCNLALDRPIPFDRYADNRATGAFILVDRMSNATVACGMVDFALRRAANVHWQHLDVSKDARARQKHQRPCILWFTGLSGSGKSTLANLVEKRLLAMGRHTYLLDGDNVRHGLCRDLGFTPEARVENIRRVAECARLFVDAGLIVLTAFISPFRNERRLARDLVEEGEFMEIFVDCPLAECERRDPKGLYKKARAGGLPNFTGIDSPYETPDAPEMRIDSAAVPPEQAVEAIVEELARRGIV